MYGFEIGDHVKVVSFIGQPVFKTEGEIVEFQEKATPRDRKYPGNKYTHWAIVKITGTVDEQIFKVDIGEGWPAQFDEIEKC